MELNNVASLISNVNNNQTGNSGQNSAIPGAPPIVAQGTGANVNDFGPAGVLEITNPSAQYTPDMNRVRELWNDNQAQVDSFRRMIETLLNRQAETQGLSQGFSFRDIEVTDEMRAEAQAMVDEGGYFSAEETAARILDFAVAITGGDPGLVDLMRDAVNAGFRQAERRFGGELPEISHQTLQAVMDGFDEWAEAGSASAISLLNRE